MSTNPICFTMNATQSYFQQPAHLVIRNPHLIEDICPAYVFSSQLKPVKAKAICF